MKLKKLVKYLDGISDTKLYIGNKEVWSGATCYLQVAASDKKTKELFIKECIEDNDTDAINLTTLAYNYINYKIDSSDDYDGIYADTKKNVTEFLITIK